MNARTLPLLCLAAASAFAPTDAAQIEGLTGTRLAFAPVVLAADEPTLPEPVWNEGQSGTKFALLRLVSPGAAAYRFQFDEVHLAPGARLFLYGVDPAGKLTTRFGPYESAGPADTGEFLSRIIPGPIAVIEVQSSEPSDWPFRLGKVSRLEAQELAGLQRIAHPALTETALQRKPARGEKSPCLVQDQVRDCDSIGGKLLFQGDIVATAHQAIESSKSGRRDAILISGESFRWPSGKIPYVINANLYPDPESGNPDSRLTEAIARFNDAIPGMLVRRTDQADYVEFTRTDESTCSSPVGRQRERQYLYVADGCSSGSMQHEIAHAAGLWHEQSREDRDDNVTIFFENILDDKEHNFEKHVADGDDIGAYDFGSMMHYGRFAFSSNGRATIRTIPAGIAIGQRIALSAGDIAGIKRVQCTYTLNPSVLQVPFEGGDYEVRVTSPGYCSWTVGGSPIWVDVNGGGSGNGTIAVSVQRNRTIHRLEANVTVGNRTLTILQGAAIR